MENRRDFGRRNADLSIQSLTQHHKEDLEVAKLRFGLSVLGAVLGFGIPIILLIWFGDNISYPDFVKSRKGYAPIGTTILMVSGFLCPLGVTTFNQQRKYWGNYAWLTTWACPPFLLSMLMLMYFLGSSIESFYYLGGGILFGSVVGLIISYEPKNISV